MYNNLSHYVWFVSFSSFFLSFSSETLPGNFSSYFCKVGFTLLGIVNFHGQFQLNRLHHLESNKDTGKRLTWTLLFWKLHVSHIRWGTPLSHSTYQNPAFSKQMINTCLYRAFALEEWSNDEPCLCEWETALVWSQRNEYVVVLCRGSPSYDIQGCDVDDDRVSSVPQ